MPAGGSPQPMSVDPDRSTPTQAREAVLQRPQSALSTRSAGSTPTRSANERHFAQQNWKSLYASVSVFGMEGSSYRLERLPAIVDTDQIQNAYQWLKTVTASLVEIARTRDIILAPPQAAPPPPTPELAQVLSAVQALSEKVAKLETAASKPPPAPQTRHQAPSRSHLPLCGPRCC
ncbi:hypothetical protein H0H81_000158 [Sphagnurus paluster]|uniref:Uncharacterized protein n=1 Tax=Sphagnurus paluster TaxID=117069 RepID=A0A9P7K3J1_9AGAR|nr:hypothetical protein H0H81_000158 [Sphagnurus paluster]